MQESWQLTELSETGFHEEIVKIRSKEGSDSDTTKGNLCHATP